MPRKVDPWGRVIISSHDLIDLLYRGVDPHAVLVEPDDTIERFNALCQMWDKPDEQLSAPMPLDISPEDDLARRQAEWLIPAEFADLDVRAILLDSCSTPIQRQRVEMEMDLYEARDLLPLLRLMMSLVSHFRKEGIVWGVGRGSSVASYVLFLIGIHKIDSIKYGLDVREFLK